MYAVVKNIHVGAVGLSLTLFLVRGGLMLRRSPLLDAGIWRVLPHVVDTVLLAAGVTLAVMMAALPGWLIAKLVALVLYILLGSIALKRGWTSGQRLAAFVGALLVFAYIVGVALTKNVWSWLS